MALTNVMSWAACSPSIATQLPLDKARKRNSYQVCAGVNENANEPKGREQKQEVQVERQNGPSSHGHFRCFSSLLLVPLADPLVRGLSSENN